MTNITVERATSAASEFQKWLMTTDSRVEGVYLSQLFPSHVWHLIHSAPKRCGIVLGQNNASFLIHTTPPPFSQLVRLLLMYQYTLSNATFLWWQESELHQVSVHEFCDCLLLWSKDFVWENSQRKQIEQLRSVLSASQNAPVVESAPPFLLE
ncbi:MAG: hypothetical protein NVSMB38_45270 [Ktedonobacteraceae bacterium]